MGRCVGGGVSTLRPGALGESRFFPRRLDIKAGQGLRKSETLFVAQNPRKSEAALLNRLMARWPADRPFTEPRSCLDVQVQMQTNEAHGRELPVVTRNP